MAKVLLPSGLASLTIPGFDFAPHLQDIETLCLGLASGELGVRRLLLTVPIRHGKSSYINCFIAWLLICRPELRILRVMASSDTAEMMAAEVLRTVDKYGWQFTGTRLDKKKQAVSHFKTTAGGGLRSIGSAGDVESWTFSWIFVDDILSDPYEIRQFSRRDQVYKDMCSKFFSRVDPMGKTKFIFVGSRRHPDDPQGRLLEVSRQASEEDRWAYHHQPAILNEGTDHEEALWPASREFNLAGLQKIRDEKIVNGVLWEWAANFQGDPTGSPDTLAFDAKWLTPEKILYDFPSEALPPAKFRVFGIDPSMGAGHNEWNDFFAAIYLHIAEDSTIYVDDLWLSVAKPDVIAPMVSALICRHPNCDVVAFESNAGGLYAAELIKNGIDSLGGRFPVVFKTYSGMDEKISRISLNLYEILQNNKLKIRDCPMGRVLLSQIAQFPTAKLDGPDALATGIIVLKEMLLR